MRSPFVSCWSGLSKRLTKCYRLLLLPLVPSQSLKVSPVITEENMHHRGREPEAPELELL